VPFIIIPIPGVKMMEADHLCAGYHAPENLANYATYLNAQIWAFRDLKHDAICVRSGNNRDVRNSTTVEDNSVKRKGAFPPDHWKMIAGGKLRVMIVEKGLLRETKIVCVIFKWTFHLGLLYECFQFSASYLPLESVNSV